MQDSSSRLSKLGKKTLENRSNFNLLQEINEYDQAGPKLDAVYNQSTVFLDENDNQVKVESEYAYINDRNTSIIKSGKQLTEKQSYDRRVEDMYSLPITNNLKNETKARTTLNEKKEARGKRKQEKKKERIGKIGSSSFGENSRFFDKNEYRSRMRQQGTNKYNNNKIDFISGDLFQIQDIISDISKIVASGKNQAVIQPSQPKPTIKKSKSRKFNFPGFSEVNSQQFSRLDEMLMNYKSFQTENEIQSMYKQPINDSFYKEQTNFNKSRNRVDNRFGKLNFPKNDSPEKQDLKSQIKSHKLRKKNKNIPELSFVVVRLELLPVIPAKWDKVFLRFQSYPQQEAYKSISMKALEIGLPSYSVFMYENVGLVEESFQGQDLQINSKQYRLMSEEQYVKKWEQQYFKYKKQVKEEISEPQKETLMQFDIEWYRTLIEYCYHIGLEDLLQKQYDINSYMEILKQLSSLKILNLTSKKTIKKQQENKGEESYGDDFEGQDSEQISSKLKQIRILVLENQLKYLDMYFKEVYDFGSSETVIGLVKLENMSMHDAASKKLNDKNYVEGQGEANEGSESILAKQEFYKRIYGEKQTKNFAIQKLLITSLQNASQLVLIRQLCGVTSSIVYGQNGVQISLSSNSEPDSKKSTSQNIAPLRLQLITNEQQVHQDLDYEVIVTGESPQSWQLNLKIRKALNSQDTEEIPDEKGEAQNTVKKDKKLCIPNEQITLAEELLFGSLYQAAIEYKDV